jgi:hypothetical protein
VSELVVDKPVGREVRQSTYVASVDELALTVPADWGDLPLSAAWDDEVQWVYQNRHRCIAWKRDGTPKINLFVARTSAPSEGAIGLIKRAADDPKGFDDILKAVKKGADDDEPEKKRGERRAIAEVRKVLERYIGK